MMSEGIFKSNADTDEHEDFNAIGENGTSDLGKSQTSNPAGDVAGSAAGAGSGSDMAMPSDDADDEAMEVDEPASPGM